MLSALLLSTVASTPTLDLSCALSPGEAKMTVHCAISVPRDFVSGNRLKFNLGPEMETPKVQIDGHAVELKKESESKQEVAYSLPVASAAGPVKLDFDYASAKTKSFVFMIDKKECLAGGYNTLWFPSFDDNRRMLGTMRFTAPSSFIVKASGREIGNETQGTQKTTTFRIENPTVPTFAAAPFRVVRVPGRVPVTLYLLKDRPDAASWAQGVDSILKVLQGEFGPYPFPGFAIIETPSPESSQMGFSGASFEGFMFGSSDSLDAGFNLAYFGHEIGHQWWGNYIGTKGSAGSYCLNEGLAQYGSLQVIKKVAGADLARRYRTTGYPGYSDWQTLTGALAYKFCGYDLALSESPKDFSILNHQLANSKGFLAWETIAAWMGHEAFSSALREVTRRYAWGSVSWEEFWAALQSKTSVPLAPLRAQWFDGKGLPTAWAEWSQEGSSLRVTLRQSSPAYRLKMPLVVRLRDGSSSRQWVSFDQPSSVLSLKESRPVLDVALDPDHETLHSTPALDAQWAAYADYAKVDFFYGIQGKRPEGIPLLTEALGRLPKPDPYGVEFLVRYTLGGELRRAGKMALAKEQLLRALACPVRRAEFLPSAYLRLAAIAKGEGHAEEAEAYLRDMMSAEGVLAYPSGVLSQVKTLFPDWKP